MDGARWIVDGGWCMCQIASIAHSLCDGQEKEMKWEEQAIYRWEREKLLFCPDSNYIWIELNLASTLPILSSLSLRVTHVSIVIYFVLLGCLAVLAPQGAHREVRKLNVNGGESVKPPFTVVKCAKPNFACPCQGLSHTKSSKNHWQEVDTHS